MEEKTANKEVGSQLQSLRSKATVAKILTYGSGAAAILCFITGLIPVAIVFIVLALVGGYQLEKNSSRLKKILSDNVISSVLKEALGDAVEYNPWGKINPGSMVFPFSYNCADGSDLFKPANKEFKKIYWELAKTKQKPLPYVPEILEYAVKNGKRNYVYTRSGKEIVELLDAWGLTDKFTFIIDATMDFPTKPDPAALNWLAERFSMDKSKCLMIGDRALDTECVNNAGMRSCLYDYEGYYPDTYADYKINSIEELKDII